jgi:hypothetical protein
MVTKSTGWFLILLSLFSGVLFASSGIPISASAARAHAEIRSILDAHQAHRNSGARAETPFTSALTFGAFHDGHFVASQMRAERIRQVLVDGTWQDQYKEESYQDPSLGSANFLLASYTKVAGEWENFQMQQTEYAADGSNRLLHEFYYDGSAGKWQIVGTTTFAYNGNLMIGFYTDWDVDHDTFLDRQLRTEYKWDPYLNLIQEINYKWTGERWQETERMDLSYDDDWLLIAKVHSAALDESGTIKPDYKIEMNYNRAYGWLISEVTSTPTGPDHSWRVERQRIYTHGAYGQVSLVLDQVDDGSWRNERLTTLAFDNKPRPIGKIVQIWQNGSWSDSLKETTLWDDFGRVSTIIDEATTGGRISVQRWVYSYPAAVTEVAGDAGQVPDDYSLSNYPNPFNPTTSVLFTMPNADEVTLRVFDLQGRQIAELLHNARMQAGAHQIAWNGRDFRDQPVASGIYLFEWTSGQVRQVARGLLLK